MKTNKVKALVLAATMLLGTFAVAQQEVAPDHFDGSPATAQKTRTARPAKSTARKTNVATKKQGNRQENDRQIAMAGK